MQISIITPSYQQAAYLEETISSVRNQVNQNYEHLIIDGGSTDRTIQILEKHKRHLAYVESAPDRGQTHAINKGIQKAKGDIIGWINSDDLLAPGAVETVIKFFQENPTIDFVHGRGASLVKGAQRISSKKSIATAEYLGSFPYCQPGTFWRRRVVDKIGNLDEYFHYTMDKEYFLRIHLAELKVRQIDQVLGIFRKQPLAKTSTHNNTWLQERFEVITRLANTYPNEKIQAFLKGSGQWTGSSKSFKTATLDLNEHKLIEIVKVFSRDTITFLSIAERNEEVVDLLNYLVGNPIFFHPDIEARKQRLALRKYSWFNIIRKQAWKFRSKDR